MPSSRPSPNLSPSSPEGGSPPVSGQPPPKWRWVRGFKYWSMRQKIRAGYGLAFTVTIVGITTGFLVSRHYEQAAQAMQTEAVEDVKNVAALQDSLLELLLHQHFIPALQRNSAGQADPGFQVEFNHFLQVYTRFKQNWQNFRASNEFEETEAHSTITQTEAEIALAILHNHDAATQDYITQVDGLVQQADPVPAQPEQVRSVQAQLAQLNQSTFMTELDDFAEKVAQLSKATDEEYQAASGLLQQASALQMKIMLGSVLLSGAIGLFLIELISRTIVHPLQSVTQTVQQSIQTNNFDFQVPVASQDEVGSLAQTFNYYIQFVKQLLNQQQSTNQQLQNTLTELHRVQGQMIQSEKMSALGQMVAGVAHEINNPVNFIHGNLPHVKQYAQDLLQLVHGYQQHYPHPPQSIQADLDEVDLEFLEQDLTKVLHSMKVGSDRIREIVVSLRSFSRLDEADYKSVNLHEGIDSTLMILHHRLKARSDRAEIQIIKQYGDLPLVECYPGQLNQVFMNLIANAIDALEMGQGSCSIQDKTTNPSTIWIQTTKTEDQQARITISDNGLGIPEAIRSRLFDPFFTTKPIGKGTGLGLSISYQIITETHKGKLWCNSTPGQPTDFIIEIPLSIVVR